MSSASPVSATTGHRMGGPHSDPAVAEELGSAPRAPRPHSAAVSQDFSARLARLLVHSSFPPHQTHRCSSSALTATSKTQLGTSKSLTSIARNTTRSLLSLRQDSPRQPSDIVIHDQRRQRKDRRRPRMQFLCPTFFPRLPIQHVISCVLNFLRRYDSPGKRIQKNPARLRLHLIR